MGKILCIIMNMNVSCFLPAEDGRCTGIMMSMVMADVDGQYKRGREDRKS
jgi:hypothetical protein